MLVLQVSQKSNCARPVGPVTRQCNLSCVLFLWLVIALRLTIKKNHFNVLLKQCKFKAKNLICKVIGRYFLQNVIFSHPKGPGEAFSCDPKPAASANPE